MEEAQEPQKPEAVPCGAVITGQKIGRLVAWRRACQNRTKHPSGRCPYHRDKTYSRVR